MATSHLPTFGASEAFSKVDISVICEKLKDLDYLSKSDPCVFLFEFINRNWAKVGRTEVIDNNLNPKVSYMYNYTLICGKSIGLIHALARLVSRSAALND